MCYLSSLSQTGKSANPHLITVGDFRLRRAGVVQNALPARPGVIT